MAPGLYRVVRQKFCAGFVLGADGQVTACAPILRRNLRFWITNAEWVAP